MEANKPSEMPTQWDLGALQTALPWKRGGREREKKSMCVCVCVCVRERGDESIRG